MDTRLKDRITIITGASSGLGKATALKFANAGARIVCADLKSIGLEESICSEHGAHRATFVKCDVTKEEDVKNLVEEAVKFGGRLDIICNYETQAGIALECGDKYQMQARAHDLATEHFDLELKVNMRGVWLCCKYALQQMLKQEPREPNARGERTRGWIVNAASTLGLVAHTNVPAYCPSKFAVVGMTKQMALDYAKDRIHVNALCPSFVATPLIENLTSDAGTARHMAGAHPWGELGRPEDVADAAMFLCSDESQWVTGHTLTLDGGSTAQ
ncbi:Hypothetical predicted protein [Lecanosticta acicola]|uniref:Uncharacterized protein n=1 Tax=Lecanosticta acicola TaxID=111012 RepID=A0AAI8Z526_9PEZI|nr:Hypothetical predicted protein [Lecanosticta acicola]